MYALDARSKEPGRMRCGLLCWTRCPGVWDRLAGSSRCLTYAREDSEVQPSPYATATGGSQVAAPSQQAQLSPAIRMFRHDQPFSYGVTLDNPPSDPSTGQPAVNLQPRLIRRKEIAMGR